jgi:telomerase reverse transcriptase
MFSSDEMYQRLHRFRNQLRQSGNADKPLYFAKVDVQSCFDSIPQKPLLRLLNALISAEGYTITRYAQAKALGECGSSEGQPTITPKASWKFKGKAQIIDQRETFSDHAQKEAEAALGTVFVDLEGKTHKSRAGILALLREHIERNIVQIGTKFYRQTTGIPQGSIVSSLLCNFFYADLERRVLDFLQDGESLLLRLIDDFLLITTNHDHAIRFVQVMHRGLPEYGLKVKEEKSKVNFDVQVDGRVVSRLPAATNFHTAAMLSTRLILTSPRMRLDDSKTVGAYTASRTKPVLTNFQTWRQPRQSTSRDPQDRTSTARRSGKLTLHTSESHRAVGERR